MYFGSVYWTFQLINSCWLEGRMWSYHFHSVKISWSIWHDKWVFLEFLFHWSSLFISLLYNKFKLFLDKYHRLYLLKWTIILDLNFNIGFYICYSHTICDLTLRNYYSCVIESLHWEAKKTVPSILTLVIWFVWFLKQFIGLMYTYVCWNDCDSINETIYWLFFC